MYPNLVGKEVKYKTRKIEQKGEVVKVTHNRLYVKVNNEIKEFAYPESIGTYIFLDESIKVINEVDISINENKDNSDLIEYESKLLEKLEKLGFEGFLHTTELKNFESIIESGFCIPRSYLDENHIEYKDKANKKVIENTSKRIKEQCRFYYYFKTPTNYSAHYENPVILVFDKSILSKFRDKCTFYDGNASSKYTSSTRKCSEALEFDWDTIFSRGAYSPELFKIKIKRNAEFVIDENVSIDFIKKIYFKNYDDMESASRFCDEEITKKFFLDRRKFD